MIQTPIKICATGHAVPENLSLSSDIDKDLGYKLGYIEKVTGVHSRHYAINESATDLAVIAVRKAIERSGISYEDIGCIIASSGTMEQAIPCNAAKLQARLPISRPIPAFDINMTCLGSLMAMDIAGSMLRSNPAYKYILVYASDIASVGLNWQCVESAGIFGDGAAAYIIEASAQTNQGIISSKFETHNQGLNYCEIKGGGSLYHPSKISNNYAQYGEFQMDGKSIFRLASKVLPNFFNNFLNSCGLNIDDIDWFVPHQASSLALKHMRKKLRLPKEKFIEIYQHKGNQIAASIPTALDHLVTHYPVKRGDKIMMIGTSAGMSIGAVILQF